MGLEWRAHVHSLFAGCLLRYNAARTYRYDLLALVRAAFLLLRRCICSFRRLSFGPTVLHIRNAVFLMLQSYTAGCGTHSTFM